ncbi:DsrE family protein [Streptomonospora litoralis]|uniref:DsrE/DsrF-like family protein n=1 Tax=Streptomonospora litoralis TaxID=2498135 RepID=A0A4P6Q8V1_9ACTN|nr:DsrE family protein [Streptomonospora litoralis]QBI55437.1 hypothetical protein EKD16_18365 [Streptomonospora litoralis]
MSQAAVVVLADTESHADLGRAFNALVAVKESKQYGDDDRLIFDGAGTKWPGVLSDPGHMAHKLYEEVADVVAGACGYCANAFEAEGHVHEAGIAVLDEFEGHPSFRNLIAGGYAVITF